MIPDAYPRLILDAIRGDQQHFVRRWAGRHPHLCASRQASALCAQVGRHSHRRRAASAVQCVPSARLAWCASTVCPGCLVPCCRGCCHRKAAARPPSAPTLAALPGGTIVQGRAACSLGHLHAAAACRGCGAPAGAPLPIRQQVRSPSQCTRTGSSWILASTSPAWPLLAHRRLELLQGRRQMHMSCWLHLLLLHQHDPCTSSCPHPARIPQGPRGGGRAACAGRLCEEPRVPLAAREMEGGSGCGNGRQGCTWVVAGRSPGIAGCLHRCSCTPSDLHASMPATDCSRARTAVNTACLLTLVPAALAPGPQPLPQAAPSGGGVSTASVDTVGTGGGNPKL